MNRPAILVTRPMPEQVVEAGSKSFNLTARAETKPLTSEEMRTALAKYDGILPTLGDPLEVSAFRGSDLRCRILANFGVGYNHIDVKAARAAGITVTNTPGVVTDATADIAVMLMFMTARRAGEGERLVRGGAWTGWHPTQLLGQHLTGKTVGVIGMGRIGQAVARRCHYGFRMPVVYYNRSMRTDREVAFAEQLDSITAVMQASDIVSINVPGGAETRHLIDAAAIESMKSTAILVNTARGDVIDEAALVSALREGRIAGAGLDVYEAEPYLPPALLALENVTLLPHLGTAALEVRTEMGLMAVANLRAFFAGDPVPNPVN